MGIVYEAWEASMERRVALKMLPGAIAADPRAVTRFVREAQAAGKLAHPSVVAVHGMGLRERVPYYVMEFVDGETLAEALARLRSGEARELLGAEAGSLGFHARLAEAFATVAEGLQHAHSRGVIHRDIKPSNLMLDGGGRLRILDFGLARLEGLESLTLSGDFVGTPLYVSPEQARARKTPIDHRTDVYSLGATLYEAVTLRPPFRGSDHQDTLSQIISRDPVPPRRLEPRVPKDLETIVLKCLRKEPGERYRTAEALAQDLARFARGDPIEARPQSRWEVLLRRAWRLRLRIAAIAVTALLALSAALLVSAYHGRALEAKEARYRELVLRAVGSLEVGGLGEPLVHRNAQRLGGSIYPYVVAQAWQEGDPAGRRARGALEELEEAVRLFPKRPEARYHQARGLWLLGRRREALEAAGEALGLAPAFGPLRGLRAAILAQGGKPELAEREREEARRLGGAEWTEPWFRAREAAAAGDWAAAAEAFGELLAREKDQESFIAAALELRLGRGLAYLHAGQPEKALIDFARAHDRWPEALAPAYLIGRSLVLQKQELAAAWFREYQRFTRRSEGEVFRFLLDLMNRDFETLGLWVEAMPPSPVRDRLVVWFHLEGGRQREAVEAALGALKERPDDPVDLAHLAVAKCVSPGGADEAARLMAQAYARDPQNPVLYALAACVSHTLGRFGESERWCRRMLEVDPEAQWALVLLGDALQAQGKIDEAVEAVEQALQRFPLSPVAHNILASIHLFRRNLDAARHHLGRARELDPEDCFILSNLGIVEHSLGHLEEAERILRRTIDLWPGYPRPAAALVAVLADGGRLSESPPLMLRALEQTNHHGDGWVENVHRFLRDALRGGSQLGEPPELDRLASCLEALAAGGVRPPHLLESLSLLLVHAPGSRDPERALALAREASELRPGHPDALATLAAVHARRGELAEAICVLESVKELPGRLRLQLDSCRESHLPSLASYASADWALERARREVLIADGARWRYLVAPPEAAPAGWTETDFPDEAWSEGPSGFGYGGGDDATLLEPRRQDAVHIRHRFVAQEPHRYRRLLLSLRVDGAYAAWLNGLEVARGVADAAAWLRRRPHVFLENALDPRLLQEGENLLALSASDAALWGRGLSLIPVLTAELERHREAEQELRERFAAAAQSEEERRVLAYLDARLLEEDGNAEEAATLYAELALAERHHPEPHLRHAERLVAGGDAAKAEEHLRRHLAEGLDHVELWELWSRIAFRDLGWSASDLLAKLPAADSSRARELRWLVETLEAAGAIRINCGGKEDALARGVAWGADRFFASGGSEWSNHKNIESAAKDLQRLYRVARKFPAENVVRSAYDLPLPRGRYRVTLHFAEIDFDFQAPGRRVFDVLIEGRTALDGYDPVARCGFATAETVSSEPVLVEDGRLEIEFVHRVRNPLVSAVEVERVD
jgi:tetratricopeptide (TPR) repeat protein